MVSPVLRAVVPVLLAGLTVLRTSGSAQAEAAWVSLLSPSDMIARAAAEPVQIIDIRKAKQVRKGTIPGAVWLPFAEWRGVAAPPERVAGEAELEAFLGAAGIVPDAPVVIFHDADKAIQTGRAAIVYWLLKTAGFERIAILDGGYKAWDGAGLATAEAHRAPQPAAVDLTYRYDWWADPMTVFGVASSQVEGHILDARFDAHVRKSAESGKPLQSIPSARYVSADLFIGLMSTDAFAPEDHAAYRADLEARGVVPDEDLLVSICQTGELSALSWFYASEVVGIDRVMYYPDAIKGWEADGGMLFGLLAEL